MTEQSLGQSSTLLVFWQCELDGVWLYSCFLFWIQVFTVVAVGGGDADTVTSGFDTRQGTPPPFEGASRLSATLADTGWMGIAAGSMGFGFSQRKAIEKQDLRLWGL